MHMYAHSGNPAEPVSPRKRPVIIFEEGGGWEDVRQPPGPGSATKGDCDANSVAVGGGPCTNDSNIENNSNEGGLRGGISNPGAVPRSQASHSNDGGSVAPSSSSLSRGLSMLGRLTGGGKGASNYEGTDTHTHSGGSTAGGLSYGKRGIQSAARAAKYAPCHGLQAACPCCSEAQARSVQLPLPRGGYTMEVSKGGWALWCAMLHVASSRADICTDKIKRDSDSHRLKVCTHLHRQGVHVSRHACIKVCVHPHGQGACVAGPCRPDQLCAAPTSYDVPPQCDCPDEQQRCPQCEAVPGGNGSSSDYERGRLEMSSKAVPMCPGRHYQDAMVIVQCDSHDCPGRHHQGATVTVQYDGHSLMQ
eukprot:1159778-Pelagomonas_calceolata.AAC.13